MRAMTPTADQILAPLRALLPDDIFMYGSADTDVSLALESELACTTQMVAKRRDEFLTGRTCARRALRAFGVADAPLLAAEDRVPRWPQGVVGSISHTRGLCVATVAAADTYLGIGIDVERRDAVKVKLERYIATPAEAERHADVPGWRTLAFSAKEAVFKCLNPPTGLWLEFRDVELIEIAGGRFRAHVTPKDVAPFEIGGLWAEVEHFVTSAVTLRQGAALATALGRKG